MQNISANFVKDWHDDLRNELEQQGYSTTGTPDEEIPLLFFNAINRRIEQKPRAVHTSSQFVCPSSRLKGWTNLCTAISSGSDLTPYLSRRVSRLVDIDDLLNEWGIHHFHLGENLEKDGFIERNDEVVFALVHPDAFYAINVYKHGDWAKSEMIEIVHQDWPSLISSWKIYGIAGAVTGTPSDQERMMLRKARGNSFVKMQDGTVYGPIGGGFTASGHNIIATIQTDKFEDLFETLQNEFFATFEEDYLPHLVQLGYDKFSPITATLQLKDPSKFVIHIPEFKVNFVIDRNEFIKASEPKV